MATSDGYGQQLAERLRAEEEHAIVTRALRTANMVTETRCDDPVLGLSRSIQREDAHLVVSTLRDLSNRQYWEDGRKARAEPRAIDERHARDAAPRPPPRNISGVATPCRYLVAIGLIVKMSWTC
jgi:hypothetical protein